MKLQDQVITSEQSKILYDLWFKKKSSLEHVFSVDWEYRTLRIIQNIDTADCKLLYPAYTASEIIDILPKTINNKKRKLLLEIVKEQNWWYHCLYIDRTAEQSHLSWILDLKFAWFNLTVCLWNLLIYLITNWYIKPSS